VVGRGVPGSINQDWGQKQGGRQSNEQKRWGGKKKREGPGLGTTGFPRKYPPPIPKNVANGGENTTKTRDEKKKKKKQKRGGKSTSVVLGKQHVSGRKKRIGKGGMQKTSPVRGGTGKVKNKLAVWYILRGRAGHCGRGNTANKKGVPHRGKEKTKNPKTGHPGQLGGVNNKRTGKNPKLARKEFGKKRFFKTPTPHATQKKKGGESKKRKKKKKRSHSLGEHGGWGEGKGLNGDTNGAKSTRKKQGGGNPGFVGLKKIQKKEKQCVKGKRKKSGLAVHNKVKKKTKRWRGRFYNNPPGWFWFLGYTTG